MRLFYAICLLLLTSSVRGQVFMRPFDNAAAMGMGGATIAMPNLSAGLNNAGQLGLGAKFGAYAGSALPYALKDWQSAYFQGFIGIGKTSGVGLGVTHAGTELYSEQDFQFSYGRKLGPKFYLGSTIDVLHNNAQEYGAATALAFNIDFLAQALSQVWIGGSIQNPLQQKLGSDLLPTVVRIGATWKPSDLFLLALETEKDLSRPTQVKAGLEYQPAPMLAIRAGTRAGKVARMSFGLGLRLKNQLTIDVGSEWHPTLGLTPAAMIAWRK